MALYRFRKGDQQPSDVIIHYGRSIRDGAPGVGTGNWDRGGSSLPELKIGKAVFRGVNKLFKKNNKEPDKIKEALEDRVKNNKVENEDIIKKSPKHVQKMFNDKWDPSEVSKNWEENKKHLKEVADLGIKAIQDHDGIAGSGIDNGWRNWFLFEDQTIGMPLMAHYIISGYTAKQVKDLVSTVRTMHYTYDDPVVFNIKEGQFNDDFIDTCERIFVLENSSFKKR